MYLHTNQCHHDCCKREVVPIITTEWNLYAEVRNYAVAVSTCKFVDLSFNSILIGRKQTDIYTCLTSIRQSAIDWRALLKASRAQVMTTVTLMIIEAVRRDHDNPCLIFQPSKSGGNGRRRGRARSHISPAVHFCISCVGGISQSGSCFCNL